jgi:putative ABC transport system permease protein
VGEGIALGLAGSLLGVTLGAALAALILHVLAGDLGNGQLRAAGAGLRAAPGALAAFFVFGTVVAAVGGWFPARMAAHQSPAPALKGGGGDFGTVAGRGWRAGVVLLLLGALMAWAPAINGLPLFGYAAIGALLLGAVLLVPALTSLLLKATPRTHRPVLDTAIAQMRENVGHSALSLSSIIVSFSLMVAMAIMVYSFRVSFDHWLGKLLPADLQIREPFDNDTAYWSPRDQASIAGTPGIARAEFRRTRQLWLDPNRAPIVLIARGASGTETAGQLPLMAGAPPSQNETRPVIWISEALRDVYGVALGQSITLPLKDPGPYKVAGIWRDYVRPSGSIVMSRDTYIRATGDEAASEASLWLDDGADAAAVTSRLRAVVPGNEALEIVSSSALRERSLKIFDRAFIITYALEAIAVFIGLLAISFAASSAALARRAEFGMLRHVGMLKRQAVALLASEGVLTSIFGVIYGLTLGGALSLVLVYVVNRQSFNWSIDLAVPAWELGLLGVILIAAAALTAVISGRSALSQDAIRAVREDW